MIYFFGLFLVNTTFYLLKTVLYMSINSIRKYLFFLLTSRSLKGMCISFLDVIPLMKTISLKRNKNFKFASTTRGLLQSVEKIDFKVLDDFLYQREVSFWEKGSNFL